MDRLTANRYISLQQKIASSGGGVPQEIVDEVEALDATVNGDETQDPPVVGLVDIVGDLESTVEDLDTTLNGDPTAEPPIPPLLASAGNMRITVGWENPDTTQDFAAGNINLSSSDYDMAVIVCKYSTSVSRTISNICLKGSGGVVSASMSDNIRRVFDYSTDTQLSALNGQIGSTTDNSLMIPVKVYLIKIMSN